ncbi:hypothetical protein N7541_006571 [Penicillium brevicompactum]|uniref:Uncharacterized protein n=1 Tax=Penicillium brevicompactum TaxID=5074 RepID=A0A9W9R5A2_PENBR|nr:hypothetical protein N7541_006571 [Penicillium brevicompactum]
MAFGRRKRSASAHLQPLSSPAAQSAQSAASHAFLKSQPSNASLSSAAAAAALRNLTPTPTQIENVQTKRMVERRASTQSQAPNGRRSASASATLRRSASNSSMTGRTFRDQSPGRPATSSGPASPPKDVPPLPSFPSQYAPRKQPGRRTLSMEPTMRSPPGSPPRSGAREQGRGSPIHMATHQRVTNLGTLPELERSGSRNSVNFSYPTGSRPTSPSIENTTMSLQGAIEEVPEPAQEKPLQERTPNRPKQASSSVEGSPAAGKSGRLAGSAAAAALAVGAQKDSSKAAEQRTIAPASIDNVENARKTAVIPERDTSSRALPERWPSTVKQEESDDKEIQTRQGRNRMSTASPDAPALAAPHSPSGLQPEPHLRQSSSPGRSARFAKLLEVTGTGDQVHQPPPRSVSPVKSALKHSRGSSLSPDRRLSVTGRVHPSSELSDGTSVASDEGSRIGAKKKAAKVSFDDEAEVVGVAASPPTSPEEYTPESPPTKAKSRMSWLGVGKKAPPAEFASDDDWNVVIKPRQELPSFGSIRGNRDGGLKRSPIPDFSDESSSSESDVEPKQTNHAVGELPKAPDHGYFPSTDANVLEQLSIYGAQPAADVTKDAKTTDETEQPTADSELSVPAIAVEPATPPAEEHKRSFDSKRSSMDQYQIPGGFPPSGSERSLKSAKKTKAQTVASAVPKLNDADTDEDYSDSIYSDAAEDIDVDVDGDGYGSINAIVDRPAPTSAPTQPLETVAESREATPKPVNRTLIDKDAPELPQPRTVTPTNHPEESPASSPGEPAPPQPQPRAIRNISSQNGSPQAHSSRVRPMSMAVDTSGASRTQDRWSSNEASPQSAQGKPRPLSVGPALHKPGLPGFPQSLRRQTSNGSDSSSSFKRSSPRGDAVTMRRTMRAGAGSPRTQPERNESPLDHRPMSAGSSNGTMRKTLRGPAGGERYSFFSTNKKAPPRAKFTKPPPKAARSTRFANSDGENEDEARPQYFTSRFADSSDEEEPRGNALRPVRGIPRRQGADDGDSTELDDSSEESPRQQAHRAAAPVAIASPPRSRGKNAPQSMSGMAAVAKQRGMTQRDLEEFIMAPPSSRKPGLLTRLGIKKPKNSDHRIRKSDAESPSRRDTPLERSRMELDEVRDGPANGNYTTVTSMGSPQSPHSKLVKRNSKRQSTGPESWPLSPAVRDEPLHPVAEQPLDVPSPFHDASQPVRAARNESVVNGGPAAVPVTKEADEPRSPDLNHDSASEITNPEEHGQSARDVVIAGSGRKKRFPLLRKAFGLRA